MGVRLGELRTRMSVPWHCYGFSNRSAFRIPTVIFRAARQNSDESAGRSFSFLFFLFSRGASPKIMSSGEPLFHMENLDDNFDA